MTRESAARGGFWFPESHLVMSWEPESVLDSPLSGTIGRNPTVGTGEGWEGERRAAKLATCRIDKAGRFVHINECRKGT
jgi:hypothetical protein